MFLTEHPIPVGDFGIDGIPGDPDLWDVAIDWMLEWVAIFYQYDFDDGFVDVLSIQLNDRLPDES